MGLGRAPENARGQELVLEEREHRKEGHCKGGDPSPKDHGEVSVGDADLRVGEVEHARQEDDHDLFGQKGEPEGKRA